MNSILQLIKDGTFEDKLIALNILGTYNEEDFLQFFVDYGKSRPAKYTDWIIRFKRIKVLEDYKSIYIKIGNYYCLIHSDAITVDSWDNYKRTITEYVGYERNADKLHIIK